MVVVPERTLLTELRPKTLQRTSPRLEERGMARFEILGKKRRELERWLDGPEGPPKLCSQGIGWVVFIGTTL